MNHFNNIKAHKNTTKDVLLLSSRRVWKSIMIRAPRTVISKVCLVVNISLAMLRDNSWLFWIKNHAPEHFSKRFISNSRFANIKNLLESWPWHFQWYQMLQLPRWLSFQSKSWRKFAYHHGDEGPNEELIPFECYSRTMFDHLRVACRQRSNVAGQVGFPPCPKNVLF